jgi:hypothetical protein
MWAQKRKLKEKEKNKTTYMITRKYVEVQVLKVSKTEYKRNINVMIVISNLDLLVVVITVHLMPNAYYATKL